MLEGFPQPDIGSRGAFRVLHPLRQHKLLALVNDLRPQLLSHQGFVTVPIAAAVKPFPSLIESGGNGGLEAEYPVITGSTALLTQGGYDEVVSVHTVYNYSILGSWQGGSRLGSCPERGSGDFLPS